MTRGELMSRAGKWWRASKGIETLQAAIITPALLIVFFSMIQGVLYLQGVNLAQGAANAAVDSARLYDSNAAAGISSGKQTAERSGASLKDVQVNVTRDNTTVRATVTADVPTIIPGMRTHVERSASGPVERWSAR